MREDDLAVLHLSPATGGDEIACRAGSFLQVIDNGLGEEGAHLVVEGVWQGWMETNGVTGV